MKKFYYMTSHSRGIREIYANTHYHVYLGIKSWFAGNTVFVVWDERDDVRIFR